METKTTLADETLKSVQELIQVNIDSCDGFKEAAEHVDDQHVAQLFRDLADERTQQAKELQSLVAKNGEKAESEGSFAAAAHRGWMNLRAAFGAGTEAMLNEAEAGEDHIKSQYETILKDSGGSAVTDVLNRQYAAVKQAHDRVRDLRDSYANSN